MIRFSSNSTLSWKMAVFGTFSTLSGFWEKCSRWLGIFEGLKWKLRLSVKLPRKPHVRENFSWFLTFFLVRDIELFEWSFQFWVNFSSLLSRMDFILHILTTLKVLNSWVMISHRLDHSKVRKMHFWMIQSAKKQVFGRFLDLGLLDRLDIAYFDRTICFPTFSNTIRSWWVILKPSKCVFEWSKVPKNRFLAVFWT